MKKRYLLGLLTLSLALTACGGNKEADNKDAIKEPEKIEESVETSSPSESSEEKKTVMTEKKNQGDLAFDFDLKDLDGNNFKLSDQKGKKVYIKFWASRCPICLDGLEEFDQMSKDTEDYEVVSVVTPGNLGEKNTEDFKEWFESLGYENMRVLVDESGQIIEDYGIRSAPTNIIVGSDGVLVGVFPGQVGRDGLDQIFAEVK
jgi:peroxiredoxin